MAGKMTRGKTGAKTGAKTGGKSRKLNAYFKKLMDAKSKNLDSFEYKGAKYVRSMHAIRPGATKVPIYKKD